MKKIFLIKSFLQKSSLIIIVLTLISCKTQFNEVISVRLIPKDVTIHYNEQAFIKVNNKRFFIKKKEYYDENFNLISAFTPNAEGYIEHNKKELDRDTLFTKTMEITLNRENTLINKKVISDRGKLYNIIYKCNDTIVSLKEGSYLIFVNNNNF